MPWWTWLLWSCSALLGLAAVFTLYRALFHDRSRGRRRCPRCWYDMAGIPTLQCPECGRHARRERSMFKTRRRWGRAAAGLLLAYLAYAAATAPRSVRAGGWSALVPTPLLLLAARFCDAQGDALYQSTASPMSMSSPPTDLWDRLLLARACARVLSEPVPAAATPTAPLSVIQYATLSQFQAMNILGQLGDASSAALPAILKMSRSSKASERRLGAQALGNIDAKPERVITALAAAIKDTDHTVQAVAVQSMTAQISRTTASQRGVFGIATVFVGRGFAHEVSPAVHRQAIAALASALDSDRPELRTMVVRLIAQVGPPNESLLPILAASVRSPDRSTGIPGITAIAKFGPPSVPYLIDFLSDPSPQIRERAASWIGQPDHPGAPAVGALRPLLRDADDHVRESTLLAIMRIGPEARAALPELRRSCAADRKPHLRTLAVLAVDSIGDDEGAPILISALADPDETVRKNAALSLGKLGPRAAAATDALTTLAGDPAVQVRTAASKALQQIQPPH